MAAARDSRLPGQVFRPSPIDGIKLPTTVEYDLGLTAVSCLPIDARNIHDPAIEAQIRREVAAAVATASNMHRAVAHLRLLSQLGLEPDEALDHAYFSCSVRLRDSGAAQKCLKDMFGRGRVPEPTPLEDLLRLLIEQTSVGIIPDIVGILFQAGLSPSAATKLAELAAVCRDTGLGRSIVELSRRAAVPLPPKALGCLLSLEASASSGSLNVLLHLWKSVPALVYANESKPADPITVYAQLGKHALCAFVEAVGTVVSTSAAGRADGSTDVSLTAMEDALAACKAGCVALSSTATTACLRAAAAFGLSTVASAVLALTDEVGMTRANIVPYTLAMKKSGCDGWMAEVMKQWNSLIDAKSLPTDTDCRGAPASWRCEDRPATLAPADAHLNFEQEGPLLDKIIFLDCILAVMSAAAMVGAATSAAVLWRSLLETIDGLDSTRRDAPSGDAILMIAREVMCSAAVKLLRAFGNISNVAQLSTVDKAILAPGVTEDTVIRATAWLGGASARETAMLLRSSYESRNTTRSGLNTALRSLGLTGGLKKWALCPTARAALELFRLPNRSTTSRLSAEALSTNLTKKESYEQHNLLPLRMLFRLGKQSNVCLIVHPAVFAAAITVRPCYSDLYIFMERANTELLSLCSLTSTVQTSVKSESESFPLDYAAAVAAAWVTSAREFNPRVRVPLSLLFFFFSLRFVT